MAISCTLCVPNIDRSLKKFYILTVKEPATESQKSLNIQVLTDRFSEDLRHRLSRLGKEMSTCGKRGKKSNTVLCSMTVCN